MSDLYRIDPKAHDAYDGSYTGGLPDPISFLVDDGVLVLVKPCEHGNYNRHVMNPYGATADRIDVCPGAGLDESRGDTE